MKVAVLAALTLFFISLPLRADQKDTDFDPHTDFLKFKTFTLRQAQIDAKTPELNSPLVRKKIEDALRAQLTAKGLTEVQNRPDLVVNFRFGAANRRQVESFPAGRWGRARRIETFRFTEGTLVVNLMDTEGRELVWRGIYRDDESNPGKISNKLPDDVKKLFSDFPPKKK
jgi:Domain of unknown function (DUF4136)